MTRLRQWIAVGLMAALSVPTMVYAAGTKEYNQPIKDKNQKQVGEFLCEKDTEEWTKTVTLNASVVPGKNEQLPQAEFLWKAEEDKETVFSGDTYEVSENGTYTVSLKMPANSGLMAEDIAIEIANIDILGPEIISVTKTESEGTSGMVKITVECEDYLEKMDEETEENVDSAETSETRKTGSGLHPEGAYSFDGGKTWTKDNFVMIGANETIQLVVRDALGNETKQSIEVAKVQQSSTNGSSNVISGGSSSNSSSTESENSFPKIWYGNPAWNDSSYISGVVDVAESEETDESKEIEETKETTETKESKEKGEDEFVISPILEEEDHSDFFSKWIFMIAAGLVGLIILVFIIKKILDRRKETVSKDDKDDEDMRQVYARVDQEAAKAMTAVAAITEEEKIMAEDVKSSETSEPDVSSESVVTPEIEESAEVPVMAVEEVKETSEPEAVSDTDFVDDKVIEDMSETPVVPEPSIDISTTDLPIEDVIAAMGAASMLDELNETDTKEGKDEPKDEKPADKAAEGLGPISDGAEPEKVVIEGAHSRLTYDPETGEYKYEFK